MKIILFHLMLQTPAKPRASGVSKRARSTEDGDDAPMSASKRIAACETASNCPNPDEADSAAGIPLTVQYLTDFMIAVTHTLNYTIEIVV